MPLLFEQIQSGFLFLGVDEVLDEVLGVDEGFEFFEEGLAAERFVQDSVGAERLSDGKEVETAARGAA